MSGGRSYSRMARILWFVGFCGEMPVGLASRIEGSPEWNRHVVYRALKLGYLSIYRKNHNNRIVRTLRLTDKGLDYLCAYDVKGISYVLAARHGGVVQKSDVEKTLRRCAVATAIVMAYSAGAEILPDRKPILGTRKATQSADFARPVFYTAYELRSALNLLDPSTVPKTSRLLGIIVNGSRVFMLYYTGRSRIYWLRNQEENITAMLKTLLATAGVDVTQINQVLIGEGFQVATRIAKYGVQNQGRYFALSHEYDHCYYLTNNLEGDHLLELLVHTDKRLILERSALHDYEPCKEVSRIYDAMTKEIPRPVALAYRFDLLKLINLDPLRCISEYKPVLLCFDYQVDAMQEIVGPDIEVRGIDYQEVRS